MHCVLDIQIPNETNTKKIKNKINYTGIMRIILYTRTNIFLNIAKNKWVLYRLVTEQTSRMDYVLLRISAMHQILTSKTLLYQIIDILPCISAMYRILTISSD